MTIIEVSREARDRLGALAVAAPLVQATIRPGRRTLRMELRFTATRTGVDATPPAVMVECLAETHERIDAGLDR